MPNDASRCAGPDVATIGNLRPTQVTIGMREVEIKRRRWREKTADQAAQFLESHSIPVILGPASGLYIVDRHHLVRALYDEGVDEVPVRIIEDVSVLEPDAFWSSLESRGWTHPFDAEGRRCDYGAIPKSVSDLVDDPFRSLAGALKRAGGYAKDESPFSEFRWAEFLRARMERKKVEDDFECALAVAMNLALTREAMSLPGANGTAVERPTAGERSARLKAFSICARPRFGVSHPPE